MFSCIFVQAPINKLKKVLLYGLRCLSIILRRSNYIVYDSFSCIFFQKLLRISKISCIFAVADRFAEAPVEGQVRRDVVNIKKESVYPR